MNGYKYLIVSGDSFTMGHDLHEDGSWATYLGKTLGLKVINLAKGGAGNEFISSTLLSYLMNNTDIWNESIVMAAWSEVGRQLVYYKDSFSISRSSLSDNLQGSHLTDTVHPGDFAAPSENGDGSLQVWVYENRDVLFSILGNMEWCVYNTYKNIYSLKNFVNFNNIKFFHFDMIHPNKCIFAETSGQDRTVLVPTISPDIFDKILYRDKVSDGTTCELFWSLVSPETTEYIFNHSEYIDDIFGFNSVCHWIYDAPEHLELYQKGNEGHLNVLGSQTLAKLLEEKIYEKL